MFDPGWRQEAVEALSGGFALVVIGGGITGCGIALDAAQRGLGVLLVEQGVFGTTAGVAQGMVRRLGSLAWTAAGSARGRRELDPVRPGLDLCRAEVRAWIRHGAVLHLEDLLIRRVRLGMWDPETAHAVAPALRPVVQGELGWTFRRWRRELDRCHAALEAWHPWRPS